MAAWECPNCRKTKPRRADGARVKRTFNHEASPVCSVCREPKPDHLGPVVPMEPAPEPLIPWDPNDPANKIPQPAGGARRVETLTSSDVGRVEAVLSRKGR
jgi:hypothetical protein